MTGVYSLRTITIVFEKKVNVFITREKSRWNYSYTTWFVVFFSCHGSLYRFLYVISRVSCNRVNFKNILNSISPYMIAEKLAAKVWSRKKEDSWLRYQFRTTVFSFRSKIQSQTLDNVKRCSVKGPAWVASNWLRCENEWLSEIKENNKDDITWH